ncbi:MAG: DNRLRE domain-containing protein, partial [Candidatus Krumholzibacteria bacterium]|nr:DNRLRE domain-containing protein [Candidatus Krumholzibacteria bacterium]
MPSRYRKRLPTASCILAMGLLLAPAAALGEVYFLKAEADTWLKEQAPAEVHGADPELFVETAPGARCHAFLHFDFSSVPAGATIAGATLQLTVTDNDPTGLPIRIYRATDVWDEATATWADTGLDYDAGTVYGTAQTATHGHVFADVTTLAQEWSDVVHPNQGLALVASSTGELSKVASREMGVVGAEPLLMVTTLDAWPAMQVATGWYNGTGVNRAIAGAGFQPDVVIVKGTNGLTSVIKTATLPGNLSKPLGNATAVYSGRILSLDADGFTVGTAAEVNWSSVRYDWVALRAAPGELVVGSYPGDGADDRPIGGLGFLPGYVLVFNENAFRAVQRFAAQPSDQSFTFVYSDPLSNLVQDFALDGFVVGNGDETNGSGGDTYHYLALNTSAATAAGASYTGTGAGPRDITGAGFQPDWALVKRNSWFGASVFRSSSWSNDVTAFAGPGNYFVDGIRAMRPDGFQVGADSEVNAALAGYYWLAFRDAPVMPTTDLALATTVDNAAPKEGESVTFTLSLTNNGPDDATGVQVSDPLPPGLSYVTHVATRGTYDGVTRS